MSQRKNYCQLPSNDGCMIVHRTLERIGNKWFVVTDLIERRGVTVYYGVHAVNRRTPDLFIPIEAMRGLRTSVRKGRKLVLAK